MALSSATPPERRQQNKGLGLDQALHALQSRFTSGISPIGPVLAWLDWAAHLANSPHTLLELQRLAALNAVRITATPGAPPPPTPQSAADHRFAHPGWASWPFNLWSQGFQLAEAWALRAAAPPGMSHENARIIGFAVRQAMDMVSPSNLPWANPEVIEAARATGGRNFIEGMHNLLEDFKKIPGSQPKEAPLQVGRDIAATPGKVVLRTRLMELIQYAPTTAQVRPEPILIVPAWIMKYYILDLSPRNSLIAWLTAQGFTVFAMSWKNPGRAERDVTLDDYRTLGVMAALDAITAVTGAPSVHACGYCLGGTLLSITAAAMARDNDTRLASVTLLAAQTDFTEAGELQLFITDDQIAFLADIMAARGYLESSQMAGAFQMLRTNDLIWSRAIRRYMLGAQEFPNDLMVWNEDGTRMPARMHAEYLQRLFHDNDLAEGRLLAGGAPVALGDIDAPLFAVSTETDHIAPWRSVYKIGLLNDGDLTFVLTAGGHNAGIVSEPGHRHRHFRIAHRPRGGRHADPTAWLAATPPQDGSWWTAWGAWLANLSGAPVHPPPMGNDTYPPIGSAPGTYVLEH
jgi:polyhydroxyalkanoate synthase